MTYNGAFIIEKPPKNGRLDEYLKEFLMILKHLEECSKPLKQEDAVSIERFMWKIFKDCMNYLKEVLQVAFLDITLTVIYSEEEYAKLCKKLDEMLGQPKPCRKAIIIGSGSKAVIYIDFQRHFKNKKPIDFIANLSVSYLEELVHYTDPSKSETEIHGLVCSVVEGFLGIKLPDNVKQERLKRGRIYNEY